MYYYFLSDKQKNSFFTPYSICGERGIRTLGTVTRTTVFETVPFDRSGISPYPSQNYKKNTLIYFIIRKLNVVTKNQATF